MTEAKKLIELGIIGKAKGLNGALFLRPFNAQSDVLTRLNELFVGPSLKTARAFKILKLYPQGKSWVVSLDGVINREGAEKMTHQRFFCPRDTLPDLEEGDFYHADLIGMDVWTETQKRLGALTDIMVTPANDVLVIRSELGKELLYPFVDAYVVEIDYQALKITVKELSYEDAF